MSISPRFLRRLSSVALAGLFSYASVFRPATQHQHMAQPDPRPPKGNRPPNSPPPEPTFNWKGLMLVAAAIGLFALAYMFRNGPMGNFVSYPQFLKMLDYD